jgi:hypothetical protein
MVARSHGWVDISFDSRPRRRPANSGGHRRSLGRRGSKEGSGYQRGDGGWGAQVSDPSGRRGYRYARTRAEAAAKLTLAFKTVADNLPLPPERETVGDCLEHWLSRR